MKKPVDYMYMALEQAQKSMDSGEIPIGAVLVCRDEIICATHNRKENDHNPIAHAEMIALQIAAQKQKNWRLTESTLYVTLEPCIMCTGALLQSRLKHIVFGAFDAQYGGISTPLNLLNGQFNWQTEWIGGLLETECKAILQQHFDQARKGANPWLKK